MESDAPLLLFGAGQNASEWIKILKESGQTVVGLVDETLEKHGRELSGVQIYSPEKALARWGSEVAIFVTIFVPKISFRFLKAKVEAFGFKNVGVVSQLLKFAPGASFYYFSAKNNGEKNLNLKTLLRNQWVDQTSREHAEAFFRAQLSLDPSDAASPAVGDYFLPGSITIPDGAVYIDAGAYQGDTIEKYLEMQPFKAKNILAFEPDAKNFAALKKYVESLGPEQKEIIRIKQQAVGDAHQIVRFATLGNASSHASAAGGEEVEMVKLDHVAKLSESYFIKFDVEGAEMQALRGSESLLRQGRSGVAVSVYHRSPDWQEVTEFLLGAMPEVQFYFRTLDENGMDSMLYGVPQSWATKTKSES